MEATLAIIVAVVLMVVLLILWIFKRANTTLIADHLERCSLLESCWKMHRDQIDLRALRLKDYTPGNNELSEQLQPQLMPRC